VSVPEEGNQIFWCVLYGISTRADASEIVPSSEIFFHNEAWLLFLRSSMRSVSAASLPFGSFSPGSQAGCHPHQPCHPVRPMRFLHTAPGERGRSSTA